MTGRRLDVWQQQWRDHDTAQQADAATRQADAQERIADALTRQQPQSTDQPAQTPETESRSTETGAAPPPKPAQRKRTSPQLSRAIQVLEVIYPPNGSVPAHMSVKAVCREINKYLADDVKNRGLPDISEDTAGRAVHKLGRTQ
jgi:hypothetical protein